MQGQRQQQVALQFGVNVSTIEHLVRRLRDTGRVADRPRLGRPRVTTPRQDRAIHLAHLRNRHVTATETALTTVGNHNRHIHPKTVINRLREFDLRARRPYIGPIQFPMSQWRRI
jgi:transposase